MTSSDQGAPEGQLASEEANFRALYERYYPSVVRFFSRRGVSREDCEDLTQETFIRVFRNIGSLRDQSRPEVWLFRVATNVYLNELRRWRTRKRASAPVEHFDPEMLPSTAPSSLDDALSRDLLRVLQEAMDALSAQTRLCVMLRFGQQLTYSEIAEVTNTPINTVKVRLHRAQERLKPMLSKHFSNIA